MQLEEKKLAKQLPTQWNATGKRHEMLKGQDLY